MAKKNKIGVYDAQDVVTLACYDDTHAPMIFSSVSAKHLPNDKLREVFSRAKDYFDQHGKPIKDALLNEFQDELEDRKHRSRAKGYEDLIYGIKEHSEEVNTAYVQKRLNRFKRVNEIAGNMPKLVDMLNNDEDLDLIEQTLEKMVSTQADDSFNYIWGSDFDKVYDGIFHREAKASIPIGIPELDAHNVQPTKKEMLVLMAAPKRGKSWFGIKCIRQGIEAKWNVLAITLEMGNLNYAERLVQNLWGRSLTESQTVPSTIITKDKFGSISDIEHEPHYETQSILDTFSNEHEATQATKEYFEERGGERSLNIAQFPTGTFTMRKLNALVDYLDKIEEWHADMVVIDYPGIMKLDINNKRTAMNQLYQDIRGFGVSRDKAMVVFHQSNRDGSREQGIDDVMDETSAGEDFSVTQHADYLITYNQSPQERALNLARLYVPLNRNGKDKYQVVISQNYACGQFALTSAYRGFDYNELVIEDEEEQKEGSERIRAGDGAMECPPGYTELPDGSWVDMDTGHVLREGKGNGKRKGLLDKKT